MYCGLALHHAKLYDKIRRSEQKYKVALEVLSYHNAASCEEVEMICKEERPTPEENQELASSVSKYNIHGVALTLSLQI